MGEDNAAGALLAPRPRFDSAPAPACWAPTLLLEEALSCFDGRSSSIGQAQKSQAVEEPPKARTWSRFEQRFRRRKTQKYVTQRSATPSLEAMPPRAPSAFRKPFVGPPLSLPPQAQAAESQEAKGARWSLPPADNSEPPSRGRSPDGRVSLRAGRPPRLTERRFSPLPDHRGRASSNHTFGGSSASSDVPPSPSEQGTARGGGTPTARDSLAGTLAESVGGPSGGKSSGPRRSFRAQQVKSRGGDTSPEQQQPQPQPPPTLPEAVAVEVKRLYSNNNSRLWKIKHLESKSERMERINNCRKAKAQQQEGPDYHRDRVSRRWELELAHESFHRYFPQRHGNDFDGVRLREALADFGQKARTRAEKLQLNKVLAQFEDRATFGFGDFCTALEEARGKLRTVRSSAVLQAWKRVDLEDFGMLEEGQLPQLLELMGLTAQELLWDQMLKDLNTDANGLYSFHETEFLVSWVRERTETARRRQERELQQRHGINQRTFERFRNHLIELHSCFVEADENCTGLLEHAEALNLLSDCGLIHTQAHRQAAEEFIEHLVWPNIDAKIDFPWLLSLLAAVRKIEISEKVEDVQALFNAYDLDGSGALDIKEVCRILVDLQLQPRTPQEQDSIAQLLEEVDRDGSGQLDIDELSLLAQLIGERVSQLQRHAENEHAEELGFSRKAVGQLRQAFLQLDKQGHGTLRFSELETAVYLMGWRVPSSRLQRLVDEAAEDDEHTGTLDFWGFIALMQHVEDDLHKQGLCNKMAAEEEDMLKQSENKIMAEEESKIQEWPRATLILQAAQAPFQAQFQAPFQAPFLDTREESKIHEWSRSPSPERRQERRSTVRKMSKRQSLSTAGISELLRIDGGTRELPRAEGPDGTQRSETPRDSVLRRQSVQRPSERPPRLGSVVGRVPPAVLERVRAGG